MLFPMNGRSRLLAIGEKVHASWHLCQVRARRPAWAVGGDGMNITVQITVQSDEEQAEVVQEVARLERGSLRPETLGLSLAEARAILAGLEQTIVERQAAEFVAQERRCPHCGRERSSKDCQSIVFRTPFGKLKLASPRLYRCPCASP